MNGYRKPTRTPRMGLNDAEVVASRREHGANTLTEQKGKGFFGRFFSNLNDPIIRILLAALAVNLLLMLRNGSGNWVESAGIGAAVFLATLISTLSEYGSARAFAKLSQVSGQSACRVRRNGTVCEIPISELVVGDIVLLGAGEMIPADGLLRLGEIRTDQSAMTGESQEVIKSVSNDETIKPDAPSALFRGCTVTSGGCEMEVRVVGDKSFLGQISHEIQQDVRDSPLKLRLSKLAKQISRLGYVAAILVALASLFNSFVLDSGMQWELIQLKLTDSTYLFSQLFHAFTLGLTVIVVAVPEGTSCYN